MASLDNHGLLVTRSHIPIVVVVALGPKARLASYSLKMPVIGGVKLEAEVERLGRVQLLARHVSVMRLIGRDCHNR
jgi:hypothetical protein